MVGSGLVGAVAPASEGCLAAAGAAAGTEVMLVVRSGRDGGAGSAGVEGGGTGLGPAGEDGGRRRGTPEAAVTAVPFAGPGPVPTARGHRLRAAGQESLLSRPDRDGQEVGASSSRRPGVPGSSSCS